MSNLSPSLPQNLLNVAFQASQGCSAGTSFSHLSWHTPPQASSPSGSWEGFLFSDLYAVVLVTLLPWNSCPCLSTWKMSTHRPGPSSNLPGASPQPHLALQTLPCSHFNMNRNSYGKGMTISLPNGIKGGKKKTGEKKGTQTYSACFVLGSSLSWSYLDIPKTLRSRRNCGSR